LAGAVGEDSGGGKPQAVPTAIVAMAGVMVMAASSRSRTVSVALPATFWKVALMVVLLRVSQ
jgi:hypothetical protein